jgi:hypothetical protein
MEPVFGRPLPARETVFAFLSVYGWKKRRERLQLRVREGAQTFRPLASLFCCHGLVTVVTLKSATQGSNF